MSAVTAIHHGTCPLCEATCGLEIAGAHAGVNSNLLSDEGLLDALSGNAVLNGIPVRVSPGVREDAAATAPA